MKRLKSGTMWCLSLVGLIALGGGALYAQDESADAATTEQADAGEQQGTGEADSRASGEGEVAKSNSPDTFIPSEEISEDRSVSFPADI